MSHDSDDEHSYEEEELDVESSPSELRDDGGFSSEALATSSMSISGRGRFQAQLNPLQLKMEEERKKREAREAAEARKKALAARYPALKESNESKDEKKGSELKDDNGAQGRIPDVEKVRIDDRVAGMIRSKFLNIVLFFTSLPTCLFFVLSKTHFLCFVFL